MISLNMLIGFGYAFDHTPPGVTTLSVALPYLGGIGPQKGLERETRLELATLTLAR
jgi:hypothetical protein